MDSHIGKLFGTILVLKKIPSRKHGTRGKKRTWFLCECRRKFDDGKVCKAQFEASAMSIVSGHRKSCGCLRRITKNRLNLVGRRFGRVVVISFHEIRRPGVSVWMILCDCGAKKAVLGQSLTSGQTTSCGCKTRERASKLARDANERRRVRARTNIERGSKPCVSCKLECPLRVFNAQKASADKYGSYCKRCSFSSHTMSNYGIDRIAYDLMVVAQSGRCYICNNCFDNTRSGGAEIEHDHATGRIRGLSCGKCNKIIGIARENMTYLRLIADAFDQDRKTNEPTIKGVPAKSD